MLADARLKFQLRVLQLAYGRVISPAADARTARLMTLGLRQRTRIAGLQAVAYLLPGKCRRATSVTAAMSEQVRRVPAPDVAFWSLKRAALWSALAADGWLVGCGAREQLALRRSLVDRQKRRIQAAAGSAQEAAMKVLAALREHAMLSPPFELRCPRCGKGYGRSPNAGRVCDCGAGLQAAVITRAARCRCGDVVNLDDAVQLERHQASCGDASLRLASLPFDVAVRKSEVMLLLVDEPRRSVFAQVNQLPLRILGQPRLNIVLRPSDDDSLWDATERRWLQRGRRYRLLERLFSTDHVQGQFPFSTTATVVDYRPETALRVIHRPRKSL